jgi:hypothetical protein
MKKSIFLITFCISLLSACGGPAVYKDVFNTEMGHNVRTFNASIESCWLAANRAVLSQNFKVEKQDDKNHTLEAVKYFQDGKRMISLVMNVSMVSAGENKTTIYANASQFVEKVDSSTKWIYLLIIPIPVGSESKNIKEGASTVEDEEFYRRFFDAVERELKILKQ